LIVPSEFDIYEILVRRGTADGIDSQNSLILDVNASSIDGFYDSQIIVDGESVKFIWRVVRIVSGTGKGQERFITNDPNYAYNGTTKILYTTADWDVEPDSTSEFIILECIPYIWDGTENDNKVSDGEDGEINHLRNGFSSTEVTEQLYKYLSHSFMLGNYKGTLVEWMFGEKEFLNIMPS